MNLDRRCIFGRVSEWVIILMPSTCLITLYLPHCVDSEGHMCVSMCVYVCSANVITASSQGAGRLLGCHVSACALH